jgi:hypothetical protein
VDAPEGTNPAPRIPFSRSTQASTVGFPRLSKICRAETDFILIGVTGNAEDAIRLQGGGRRPAPAANAVPPERDRLDLKCDCLFSFQRLAPGCDQARD